MSNNTQEAGCYLRYSLENGGTLYTQWLIDPPFGKDGVVAQFRPGVQQPKWRYSGGQAVRVPIAQNCNKKEIFCEAICSFLHTAIENSAVKLAIMCCREPRRGNSYFSPFMLLRCLEAADGYKKILQINL